MTTPDARATEVSRRAFIVTTGAFVVAGLSGCLKESARATPVGAAPEPLPPRAQLPERPQPPAPVAPGAAYVLKPRTAWTNQKPAIELVPIERITRITIHHTGEYKAWDQLADIDVIRSIDRAHRAPDRMRHKRAWGCIGYHYLVGKDGTIYEGRAAQFKGAHTSGANSNNLGISVIGNFMTALPTAAQLRALEAFLNDRRSELHLHRADVYGHRDLSQSECPGDALYAWLQSYKKATKGA